MGGAVAAEAEFGLISSLHGRRCGNASRGRIPGIYAAAVRAITRDATANGWQIVSDTSWAGYEDIPCGAMQGHTPWMAEIQELAGQGISQPTHGFVQAGVNALAAAVAGYCRKPFGSMRPSMTVVEPDQTARLYASIQRDDGQPHSVESALDTIMAGLACGDPSPLAWSVLSRCADVFLSCPDFVAARGLRVYGVPVAGDPFLVSGESGAATLGALMYVAEYDGLARLERTLRLGPESQVLPIDTEGNPGPDRFRRVVWEGGDPEPREFRRKTD